MYVRKRLHMVGSVPGTFADNDRMAVDGVARWLEEFQIARVGGDIDRFRTWILGIVNDTKRQLGAATEEDPQILDYSQLEFVDKGGVLLELDGSLLPFEAEADRLYETTSKLLANPASHVKRALPMQVNITHWVDHLAFTLGDEALADPKIRAVFKRLHAVMIRKIYLKYGDEVVFQIETPYSLREVSNAALQNRQGVANVMAGYVRDVVELSPKGAKFIVHLCRGDLEHKSWPTEDDSLRPVVALANAVVDAWPASRRLEFVHLPLRRAQDKPSLDAFFYGPLAYLSSNGRFAAGIISEGVDEVHNSRALELAARVYHGDAPPEERIFEATGGPCGGGRMTFKEFVAWLNQHRRVMLSLR